MTAKRRLRKTVDERMLISCASGYGIVREEIWEDSAGKVARYNLAFVNPFLTGLDHGRVLGYDNAHGEHHRHFYGRTESLSVSSFEALSTSSTRK